MEVMIWIIMRFFIFMQALSHKKRKKSSDIAYRFRIRNALLVTKWYKKSLTPMPCHARPTSLRLMGAVSRHHFQ